MSNFLEHYARQWNRSLPWADRRIRFIRAIEGFLGDPEMAELFREWAEDRAKMLGKSARAAAPGAGEFTYYQGAAVEIGQLVENLLAEGAGLKANIEHFDDLQAREAKKETEQ